MNTKDIVMSRVHTVHAVRPLVSTGAVALVVFVLAVWGIGREVWVAQVFANMPSIADVQAFTRFFVVAFANTKFVVQALSIVSLGSVVWLAREAARSLAHFVPVRA